MLLLVKSLIDQVEHHSIMKQINILKNLKNSERILNDMNNSSENFQQMSILKQKMIAVKIYFQAKRIQLCRIQIMKLNQRRKIVIWKKQSCLKNTINSILSFNIQSIENFQESLMMMSFTLMKIYTYFSLLFVKCDHLIPYSLS